MDVRHGNPHRHLIPLCQPPSLVHLYGAFGELVHGRHGDEPYRNGFWVLNLAVGGEGELHLDGVAHPFHHGCAVVAPPDREHRYHFHRPTVKIHAHFRAGRAGGTRGDGSPGTTASGLVPVPVVSDLGSRFGWFTATIRDCRDRATAEPERAVAALWNLLWQLAAGPAAGDAPLHHPVIRALLTHLAEHLDQPVDPPALAGRLGCSSTHLNRLCHSAFGLPLVAYIRRIRLERAEHLLRHTSRSVASIASEVGLTDLQHFNKLMRRHSGRGPRALRRG